MRAPSSVTAGSWTRQQPRLPLLGEAFAFAVTGQRLGRRMDDEESLVAVDQDLVAMVQGFQQPVQPDDGGKPERPRHDGRVRGSAAELDGKAEHLRPVELRGLGRRQVVGDEDGRMAVMHMSHRLPPEDAA